MREVLERLRKAGLTAKPTKCKFAMFEVLYLGHIVGGGTVKPAMDKVYAVKNFPHPTNKTDIRSFLGLTGYYRKFIPQFSEVASPLSDLTKKGRPLDVIWTPDCENAFILLKKALCSEPILRSPNFERSFILQTDASNKGIGAVLSQRGEDDEEHPVLYVSHKLLPREQRYATVEKECLAIVWSIQQLKYYLYGQKFHITTDHQALKWLDRMRNKNSRLVRWNLLLQEFTFTVDYKPGSCNSNADGLSRIPIRSKIPP